MPIPECFSCPNDDQTPLTAINLFDIDYLCGACLIQFNYIMESTNPEVDRMTRVKQGYDAYIEATNGT